MRPEPPLRRLPPLLAALLLSPTAAGADSGAEPTPPEGGSSYEPYVSLPAEGGLRASGSGGASTIESLPGGWAGANPATIDFPNWLGQVTGLWEPKPRSKDAAERQHLTLAPFITSSPLIGVGFGVAGAGTIQLGDPATTRLSKYSTNVLITTENQFSLPLRTSINLPGGDWNLVGLWRFSKFPSPTWGIGGNTPDSAKTIVDYSLVRLHEIVNRRVAGDLYLGAGYFLDWYFKVSDTEATGGSATDFSGYPWGTGSTSFNSAPTLNLLYDSRDSAVYPTRGFYGNLNYTFVPTWLGSTTRWQSAYLDLRTYWQFARWGLLALWSYAWFNFGEVPYLELASIGSDPDARSGRGYTEGRHIGKSLVYGEAELRFTIWEWLGAVAGVNVHSASQPDANGILVDEPRFQYWWPALVVGLRILVVWPTRSNICIDFGLGRIGQKGVYLNFAEAF